MSGQASTRLSGTEFGPFLCVIRANQHVLLQKLNRGVKNLAEQSKLG